MHSKAMLKIKWIVSFTIVFFICAAHAQAKSNTERAGDVIQALIPATAYAATFIQDDKEGRKQFYKSFFLNLGVTYGLKFAINKERPKHNGNHSFPSGHTSAAFQGATFIHRRYGWEYGIPAYIGATFVGWSRVKSNKHDTTDVIAGASIGILSSLFLTTPYKGVTITPVAGKDMYGVSLQMGW